MATTNKRVQLEQEMVQALGLVPEWSKLIPEPAAEGVWRVMADFQLAETKIPNKYKELIGLSVSGATRCRYCQLFHVEAARLNGPTEEEINKACMMGARTMSVSTFLNAEGIEYDQFKKELLKIISHVKAQQGQQGPRKSESRQGARVLGAGARATPQRWLSSPESNQHRPADRWHAAVARPRRL